MYDKNLSKRTLEANAPEAIKAFWTFDKAAEAALTHGTHALA